MKQLSIKPTIHKFENARDFAQEFNLGKGDLVITNQYTVSYTHLTLPTNREV